MKYLAYISLVTTIVNLFLGIFVYSRNPNGGLNKRYFVFSFISCLWALSEFVFRIVDSENTAHIWIVLSYVFWPLAFAAYFDLAWLYVSDGINFVKKINDQEKYVRYLFSYIPAVIVIIVSVLPQNYIGLYVVKMSWGWYGQGSNVVHLITYSWGALTGLAGLILYIAYYIQTKNFVKKRQAKVAVFVLSIPVIAGTISEAILPMMGIRIYELTTVGSLFSSIFLAYAIWKLDFLAINLIKATDKIIETINDSLFLIDVDKTIKSVNKSSLKLLDYSENELIEQPINKIFSNSMIDLYNADSVEIEAMLKTKNNEEIPVQISKSTIFDKFNNALGLVLICRDMRTKKKEEIEKIKLNKQLMMNSKLASVGTLASGIAHEVNNPLLIIRGHVEALQKQISCETIDKAQALDELSIIDGALERIRAIVNGLRTYSRADTDTVEPLYIHDIIKQNIKFIETIFNKEDISFDISLVAKLAIIKGNGGKLSQVLMNLLSNARDALNEKNDNNETKLIKIRSYNLDSKVGIEISDNGVGMKKEVLEKIFDPFYTTKDPSKGTGLGLSIVQSIVNAMDGQTMVESQEGRGTMIKIEFPMYDVSSADLVNDSGSLGSNKMAGRVLVVDDEDAIRSILKSLLTSVGLQVETAKDGKEALGLLKNSVFKYLITDLKMPVMNGIELLKEVLKMKISTKLIVMTGGNLSEFSLDDQKIIREKVDGYLAKPFGKEELVSKLI